MTVKRDLQNAATLLRERGWTHVPDAANDALTIIQAVDAASSTREESEDALNAIRRVVGFDFLSVWGMGKGRTAEEVIAALEAAAEAQP